MGRLSRRLRVALVVVILLGVAVAFVVRRRHPLDRASCAADAQRVAIGCGQACSAKLAHSAQGNSSSGTVGSETTEYLDCNDRCTRSLVDIVKRCGP